MDDELNKKQESAMRRRILIAVSELLAEREIISSTEKSTLRAIIEQSG